MNCFKPLHLYSTSKYISREYHDSFVNTCSCGQCAACQKRLHNEWYFRTSAEFRNCVLSGGYVLFDCLTYRPKDRPRISNYISDIPKQLDWPCFDYSHLRLFFVRLRRYLSKRGFTKDAFKYFAATEYGVDDRYTHAPHIHLLLFVYDTRINNIFLSKAISRCWPFGRTDGIPFKNRSYVQKNTLSSGLSSIQRVCKYVSKYVVKDSSFQTEINKRITRIMFWKYQSSNQFIPTCFDFETGRFCSFKEINNDDAFQSWCKSETGKKWRRDLLRHCNQFHRQSLGYGLSALSSMNVDDIIRTNIVSLSDSKSVVMRLSLPLYYKRKLFYEQVIVDGVKYWQPTILGITYLRQRKRDLFSKLVDDYTLASKNFGVDIPYPQFLADYVVNYRGTINPTFVDDVRVDSVLSERLDAPIMFNYNSSSDKMHFHIPFVSYNYYGNRNNYLSSSVDDSFTLDDFVHRYCYFDSKYEKQLSDYELSYSSHYESYQFYCRNIERVKKVYKQLGLFA